MDWNGATGVLAVILIFGMPVFIVGIVFLFIYRSNAERQKTLRMAIEKSDTLPPELLERIQSMQKKPKTPMNDVRAGLILIAIAGGVMIWNYLDHGEVGGHLSGLAAVPGLIGVALLILGIIGLNTRKNDK